MIARLEGVLRERTPTRAVIDVGGVGYEALIPLSTFSALPEEGAQVALRIHTHARADVFQLYGFATELERRAFELLLHASRVGPRLAQAILSGIEARALLSAIEQGDVAALKAVPGIGAKMAERLSVELRERASALAEFAGGESGPAPAAETGGVRAQLLSALLNLQTQKGRAERVADEVLAELGGEAEIEVLVRAALQRLSR